jgi:hypothetical protein
MEKRGFYLRKGKDDKIQLFINIEQFKKYLEDNSKGLAWLKFTIYKNKNEDFGYNIKLNDTDHE